MEELYAIGLLLRLAKKAAGHKEYEDGEEDSLSPYFTGLFPAEDLEREISRCLAGPDWMADEASPKLGQIRRKKKNLLSNVHGELNRILQAHREYLMDAVVTMRNGSYCLPIKSEYKNRVSGVVHDQSATGSTVFIEPMAVIRMNNEIKELEIAEAKEVETVLTLLSSLAMGFTHELTENLSILARLDFIFAKARLARIQKATEPVFNTKGELSILEGRHPLLDPEAVVPIDISLGDTYDLLIVTGPNTGGKTVSLKTVGLFTLMGQAGLHIPARHGSRLAVFDDVFADIGDEQSIEQSLSTFSGHMKKIVEILKEADSRSLCLFDELGAGTDPTEGAALAIAILSFLHRMKARTIATTHYSELKVFALTTPGVENASCEFDVATLRPTYRILVGVPGKSNAFAISSKLGLPEYIIDEARSLLSKEDASFEDVLARLEGDRVRMEAAKKELSAEKARMEVLKKRIESEERRLNDRREEVLRKAKQEARRLLEEAKETADRTIRNINKLAGGTGAGSGLEKEREALRGAIKGFEDREEKKKVSFGGAEPPKKLTIGDRVRVLSMNMDASVVSLPNEKGKLFVQMGILRSQVDRKDIALLPPEKEEKKPPRRHVQTGGGMRSAGVSHQINLIGMNVDEACAALDTYLDDALLSHLPQVRIIHGRGTGALQKGVHAYLKRQNFIKSFHLAEYDDGGNAVTIAVFR